MPGHSSMWNTGYETEIFLIGYETESYTRLQLCAERDIEEGLAENIYNKNYSVSAVTKIRCLTDELKTQR